MLREKETQQLRRHDPSEKPLDDHEMKDDDQKIHIRLQSEEEKENLRP